MTEKEGTLQFRSLICRFFGKTCKLTISAFATCPHYYFAASEASLADKKLRLASPLIPFFSLEPHPACWWDQFLRYVMYWALTFCLCYNAVPEWKCSGMVLQLILPMIYLIGHWNHHTDTLIRSKTWFDWSAFNIIRNLSNKDTASQLDLMTCLSKELWQYDSMEAI